MSKKNLIKEDIESKDCNIGIFIFRKDLRIIDNRGLIKMSEKVNKIIPIFIFDPHQVDITANTKNYLSLPALKFLCESVISLGNDLKKNNSILNIFYDNPINVIKDITKYFKDLGKNFCIGYNEDYTSYSINRDNEIDDYCNKYHVEIIKNSDDYTLYELDLLLRDEKKKLCYKQYGAFKNNMLKHKSKFNKVDNKKIIFGKINFNNTITKEKINKLWEPLKKINKNYEPLVIGGREQALEILKHVKDFKDYNDKRDILDYNTTHLSAYLNFGCISEREFYEKLIKDIPSSQLINQVIWRDYYYSLLKYLPKANSYIDHVDDRYNKLKWLDNYTGPKKFKNNRQKQSWEEWNIMMNSQTGFLMVDAAIQELLKNGYMHNRCRMIVGVFSVKYLLINPLCRYVGLNDWFSRHLLDCSTSQNKLNCQWVTELDFPGKKFSPHLSPIAGRPMNISNIMIKKWDPECNYIKKWLPHLKEVPIKNIYKWDTNYDEKIHPGPIFNCKERYDEWIDICKKLK
jgi:deoxyribodipyrimidine photo-lyase